MTTLWTRLATAKCFRQRPHDRRHDRIGGVVGDCLEHFPQVNCMTSYPSRKSCLRRRGQKCQSNRCRGLAHFGSALRPFLHTVLRLRHQEWQEERRGRNNFSGACPGFWFANKITNQKTAKVERAHPGLTLGSKKGQNFSELVLNYLTYAATCG